MILQGPDIQPEHREKVFIPENKARAHSGGPLISQGRRAFCMQNVSVKRVFKVQSVFSKTWTNETRG